MRVSSRFVILPLCLIPLARALAAQASADPAALRAESLMVEAMGGRTGWETARFFDFVWAVERGERRSERRHVWDRWTGRYRLEAATGDGRRMVALFNTNTRAGEVRLDGRPLSGDSARALLERAYAIFINDTYWFLMPFKWRDPGVNLRYLGATRDATGKTWEMIELTFDGVGLTPDNRYHAYLDPGTHLLGWWEQFRHRSDTVASVHSWWTDWQWRGPIRVSLNRPFIGGEGRIYFPRAIIKTEVDERAFTRPPSTPPAPPPTPPPAGSRS